MDRPSPRRGLQLPREHGAWMMLYAPLIIGLFAYRVEPLIAVLLIIVVSSVFFAQNALGLQLRGRGGSTNRAWLAGFGVTAAAAGAVLVPGCGLWQLLPLSLPAMPLFIWQAWQRRATRRQIDHSTANEIATVAVMALGASAAYLAGNNSWTWAVGLPWIVFTLYFSGSVLYVKMRVHDARSAVETQQRWRQGLACGLFHLGLGVLSVGLIAGSWPNPAFGVFCAVATTPAMTRALIAWRRLDGSVPSLRRIGVQELLSASWFSGWIGVALAGT